MRLLLINHEYPPVGGGAATATWQLAREFGLAGHDSVVLTSAFDRRSQPTAHPRVALEEIPALRRHRDRGSLLNMGLFALRSALGLRRLLARARPDGIIAFFTLPAGPLGWLARWQAAVPYVVSLRGADVPGLERGIGWMHTLLAPVRRAALRRALAVVANSEGLRDAAVAADGGEVLVIPNGVDAEFFCPAEGSDQRSGKEVSILFAGRFQEQKNLDTLLSAAALLRGRGISFRLHLAGGGPLESALRGQAAELGLEGLIEWHGWTEPARLRDLHRSCHVFVNPSRYEGMPNAVLEAMASGLPIVASSVAGNVSVVAEGRNGLLVPPREAEALATALARLAEDRPAAAAMGAHSRERARDEFSWRASAAKYIRLFQP